MKLEDGATRIFINTRGTNRQEFSQEFLDFMEYITATTDEIADGTKSPRIKLIHEKVRKIKISEKMGVKFDFPKPVELIQYLLSIVSGENDIILDSFAGSGTTAHATVHCHPKLNSDCHRKLNS